LVTGTAGTISVAGLENNQLADGHSQAIQAALLNGQT